MGARRDMLLMKLNNLSKERSRITLDEMTSLLRRCDIIAGHQRKDYIKWLEATGRIEIEGNLIILKDKKTEVDSQ